jgi:hypothetical protein
MLPSWYIPACVVITLLLIAVMIRVLRNEARDEKWSRTCFDKGVLITYPPMTNQEWEELEERLTRQREFDRIKDVVEEARREDFAG